MWFGAGNVCVSGVVDALSFYTLTGFAKATKSCPAAKPSFKAVLEAIKFEEKPSCVEMDFSIIWVSKKSLYNPVQEQSLDPSLCMRGAG